MHRRSNIAWTPWFVLPFVSAPPTQTSMRWADDGRALASRLPPDHRHHAAALDRRMRIGSTRRTAREKVRRRFHCRHAPPLAASSRIRRRVPRPRAVRGDMIEAPGRRSGGFSVRQDNAHVGGAAGTGDAVARVCGGRQRGGCTYVYRVLGHQVARMGSFCSHVWFCFS